MADTQKSRAAILALFADNVTGQISAQDLRDFVVTMMEEEFTNPGDFWNQPGYNYTTTDRDIRGWTNHSQTIDSTLSAHTIIYLTPSGTWKGASPSTSGENYILGVLGESAAAGDSDADVLRKGVVVNSLYSARFSGFIGSPVYLQSGVIGSVSITIPTNSIKILGRVLPNTSASGVVTSTKWFFDPDWSVIGV